MDHAELANLETAFAKDPSSDAFLALSQAYLDQSRFMEAMVVCKKGIRGQPESTDGRLLLARVYAGQGKIPKAIDEVKNLLELNAEVADAHFFLGQLHERSGRFEEAIDEFKEALVLERGHAGAKEALQAKGIEFDPGPSEEELEAQRQAEEAERAAEEAKRQEEAAEAERQAAADVAAATGQTGTASPMGVMPNTGGMASPSTPPTGSMAPAAGSVPPQASGVGYFGGYDPLAQQAAASKKKFGLGFSFALFAVLLFVVAGLILFLRSNKADAEAIAGLNKQAQQSFVRETTFGLRKAAERYDKVLEIDRGHEMANARLAWIYQTLSRERNDRAFVEQSEKRLAKAKKYAPDHPLTVATQVLRMTSTGKAKEGLAFLDEFEAGLDSGVKIPDSLLVARGKAMVANGQIGKLLPILEKLKKADRPGPLAWSGHAWRRLGNELEAAIAFDRAIKAEPDHDPARAERALLLLEIRDLGRFDVVLADLQHLSDLGRTQLGPLQDGYASLARAEINRLLDKQDAAKTNFSSAKSKLGRNSEMLFVEARWAFANNQQQAGIAALEKSVEIDPNRVRVWQLLISEAASKKATRSKATAAYEKAEKIFGAHGLLIEARVELLARQRKLDQAAKFLEELKGQPSPPPEVFREIGRIQLAKRDYPAAIKTLDDAVKKAKRAPKLTKASTYTLLGRAHASNEDIPKAIDAYKEAIKAAGSYAPAYYYLAKSFKKNEQPGPAKESFQRASKLDPTSSLGRKAKKAAEAL